MEQRTGYCRFCNQGKVMEVPEEFTLEDLEEEATLGCKCREAKEYQTKKQREEQIESAKLSAKGTTYELFHDSHPEVEKILNDVMDVLVEQKIKAMTITTHGKTTAKISFSKDTIKVERVDKSVNTLETEI